jgi:hypothetical protein
MNPVSITELRVGMSREEVVAILGVPDQQGGTSRKYRTPSIFKYGNVEFNFERWKSGGLVDAYQVDGYGCYVEKIFPPASSRE